MLLWGIRKDAAECVFSRYLLIVRKPLHPVFLYMDFFIVYLKSDSSPIHRDISDSLLYRKIRWLPVFFWNSLGTVPRKCGLKLFNKKTKFCRWFVAEGWALGCLRGRRRQRWTDDRRICGRCRSSCLEGEAAAKKRREPPAILKMANGHPQFLEI